MATEFVTATRTSEIPEGDVTAVDLRGRRIAVANVGGTYYAFDDECTHAQCSLAEYGEFHTNWEQLVVRGRLDSGSYLACYVNGGRIDAAVGLNRAKDIRRMMALIKSRRVVDLEQLRNEAVDLRSLHASP